MTKQHIYQFYAELKFFKPKIWRRFQVTSDITVAKLAYIIMTMFEMDASHLFDVEFLEPSITYSGNQSKRMRVISHYGIPNLIEYDDDIKDASKVKLSKLKLETYHRLVVWYDFGDDWRVSIKLEKILDERDIPFKELPRVLKGKGYGIIDDCGGVGGLEDIVKAFESKTGEDYEQYREWLGKDDFDITTFDLNDINERLKELPSVFASAYENWQDF